MPGETNWLRTFENVSDWVVQKEWPLAEMGD